MVERARESPVVVYTAAPQPRSPGSLIRQSGADLLASRELAWRLFVRDLSARYRQSFLGVFWAVGPPILAGWIFTSLQSRGVVDFGETSIPYPVYVFVGTVLWQLFTESLGAPLRTVAQEKPLLAKVNFPREALILSSLYSVLFGLLIKLVVVAGVLLFFRIPPTWGLLAAPFAMVVLVLLGVGLGTLLAPLGLLYSDVAASLPVAVQLFFFLTPVVYPAPQTLPMSLLTILNPVSPLLVGSRELIVLGTLSSPGSFFVMAGLTAALLLVAGLVYRVTLPVLIERLGA
jgi:lipopolysaccharide transport system permease protein